MLICILEIIALPEMNQGMSLCKIQFHHGIVLLIHCGKIFPPDLYL